MPRSIFAVAAFAFMMMGSNADAGFVYNNFGPGNTFDSTANGSLDNNVAGIHFTATDSGTLTQVTLPLGNYYGSNTLTVELHADNAGPL